MVPARQTMSVKMMELKPGETLARGLFVAVHHWILLLFMRYLSFPPLLSSTPSASTAGKTRYSTALKR